MRIQSINNTVNFGYNKQLNDTVNKKLEKAKGNKELAKTLLEMNRFANATEDKLRQAEKNKNQQLVDIYSNIFINIKPTITEVLDKRFPQLKYRETELSTYRKELSPKNPKSEEYTWKDEIIDELMDEEEFKAVMQEEMRMHNIDNIDTNSKITPESKKTSNQSPQVQKNKNNKQVKKQAELLEKFTPTEYSPTGFSSLGGMDDVKEALFDKVIYPLYYPENAKLDEIEYGKKTPRGELFYGPPGCGKTAIMQALAMESGIPLYNLKISKAGSKYVNESANNVQQAYEQAVKIAEESGKPVFLAMDEMESLTSKRKGGETGSEDDKMVSTLLQIIEEARGRNVIILGATNCFDQLDDAIKSRFEDKIYIGLPDDETRKAVLKVLLKRRTKGVALADNDEELAKVVKLTNGFSNRDLTILTDKASLIARKDNRRDIMASDFIQPVNENQNMKVKEREYMARQTRPTVGFNK